MSYIAYFHTIAQSIYKISIELKMRASQNYYEKRLGDNMAINVIKNSTFECIANNKAAIKTLYKVEKTEALERESSFVKMHAYTYSFELDSRAENLSNLMAELFIHSHNRRCELDKLDAELAKKNKKKSDTLDTPFFTQCINTELKNIKNDVLFKYFSRASIKIDDFKPNEICPRPRMTFSEYYDRLNYMYNFVILKAAQNIGCDIADPDFKFSYIDLKSNDIRVLSTTDGLACIRYAFYKAHEKGLEHWIFEETSLNPFASDCPNPKQLPRRVIVEKMQELGYHLVHQGQLNDIIFYIDENDQFAHCGVMQGANTVYSVHGSMPQVVVHPINSVPKIYKNRYMIFSKKIPNPTTPWTLGLNGIPTKTIAT